MYEQTQKKNYKLVLKKIKEFDTIVIFRHQRPDGDAFGSQCGLATWIKDNFPSKKVLCAGSNSEIYSSEVFPKMDVIKDEDLNDDFLAIIVDTGDSKRIDDERWNKAKYKIKFDHHPAEELYGDLNIIINEIASCAQLIADFCFHFEKKYPLSKLAAKYLYSGIVTDSGRFFFPSVDNITLIIASKLIKVGLIPAYDVYEKLYEKDVSSLVFQKYVLNHMTFTKKGVAYYILDQKALDELGISNERGKEHLSLMSNIKNVPIWFCITEIKEKNEWRVSIRSKKIDISQVARKYHGGGHLQASGATIYSLEDELPLLIADLENLI
jgi:phosphoesterase RecJ-like protein